MNKKVSEIITYGNNNLDLIRLIAAIAVIVYHSFAINPQWGITDPIKSFFGHTSTGGIAVKIFFFISGLLVANSILTRKSPIQFIVSRSLRIFPGLAFVLLSTAFIIGPIETSLGLGKYFTDRGTYSYILNNLLLNTDYFLPGVVFDNGHGINGSLWTIRYEVIAYVVLFLAFSLRLTVNKLLASLICIVVIVEPITPIKGLLFASSNDSAIFLLAPSFALGCLFAINKDRFKSTWLIPVLMLLASIATSNTTLSALLLCTSMCLLSLHVASRPFTLRIKLRNDISYGVYLWGFPIQQLLHSYFSAGPVIGILSPILLSCMVAYVSWVLIEKPAIGLSKKISKSYLSSLPVKSTHE